MSKKRIQPGENVLDVQRVPKGMYFGDRKYLWYATHGHAVGYSETDNPIPAVRDCYEDLLAMTTPTIKEAQPILSPKMFGVHLIDREPLFGQVVPPVPPNWRQPCINTKERPGGLPRNESGYAPVGFDNETYRFGPANMVPPMVCMSWATFDASTYDHRSNGFDAGVCTQADGDLDAAIDCLFGDESSTLFPKVGHNVVYDLAGIMARRPDLISKIFMQIEAGLIHCTMIREKLLMVCTTGDLVWATMPDGSKVKLEYSLAAIGQRRLNKDRSVTKKDPTSWRTNFGVLDGVPVAEWPPEAREYSIEDSTDSLAVWAQQEEERRRLIAERGIDPFEQEPLRVAANLGLYFMGAFGAVTDEVEWLKVVDEVEAELDPSKLGKLIASGILRPGSPARPYSNGAKNPDGTPKMTEAEPPSIDTKLLKAHVMELAKQFPDDVEIKMTAPSKKFPEGQISTDGEWLEENAQHSDILREYQRRESVKKLATVEIPKMCVRGPDGKPIPRNLSPIIHTNFNPIVSTGRVSSSGSEDIPSWNSQQVPPKMRPSVIAPEGYLLCSIDYNYQDLCSWAQACYDVLGFSVLGEKINAGFDPHAFLGSQLAKNLDPGFDSYCRSNNAHEQDDVMKLFLTLKKCDNTEAEAFFKKYRTFAKPTGLGYPGGLAAKTFIAYAHSQYGMEIDLDLAKNLREIWMQTYREAQPYFDFIKNNLQDPWNAPKVLEKEGKEPKTIKLHAYTTRMGWYRAGADFCATANGFGLQSPSAMATILGVYDCTVASMDPSRGDLLLLPDSKGVQAKPIYSIHDEMVAILRDDGRAHDRAMIYARIMERSMQIVCPNVKIRCNPVLMRRWYKEADPVFDTDGRLVPWEPKKK